MTSRLRSEEGAPGQAAALDEPREPCADADFTRVAAVERVERLRIAIVQNRDLAKNCDFNFKTQLLALANEMETYVRTLMTPPTEGEWE